MPCNCDYMEPREDERRITNTAQLLVWLKDQVGRQMNPRERSIASNIYPSKDDGDYVTSELCSIIESLSERGKKKFVYNAYDATSRRLADWWDKHEAADKARKTSERRQKANAKIRKAVLAKLTPAERKVLGL